MKNTLISNCKIRNFIWPIYGKEHALFIPMTMMLSLIIFNSYIAWNIKESLIITSSGPETITFIKCWLVLPGSFLFFLIYAKLSNLVSQTTLFYFFISLFLFFFILFSTFLYPNHEFLHPQKSSDYLNHNLPSGFFGLISIYKYWTFSLFYFFTELWTIIAAGLLFWQFANSVISLEKAKRMYAHFSIFASFSVISAGQVTSFFSKLNPELNSFSRWKISLCYLTLIMVVSGLFVMILYYFLNNYILPSQKLNRNKKNVENLKISVMESIKIVYQYKYLFLIAILVASYGISINLIEICWKQQIKLQYKTPNEYNTFSGLYTTLVGISTIIMIFFGSPIVRKFGWKTGALATPVIMAITSVLFFACIIFRDLLEPIYHIIGITPLMIGVIIGLIQNVLIKGAKHALFDSTKEMAYIPMTQEYKVKGKAAVDLVGNRFGKATGGLIQQIFFVFVGPIGMIIPYLAICVLVIVIIWILATSKLSELFINTPQN